VKSLNRQDAKTAKKNKEIDRAFFPLVLSWLPWRLGGLRITG
jgi:hypothetical protein